MDSKKEGNYIECSALKVNQPLGSFYVIAISAKQLLDISFSEPLRYIDKKGSVVGSQRPKDVDRLKEIATYIESAEMAFPNSIILAANYSPTGNIVKDESERWRAIEDTERGICKIIIPQKIKIAAIIDGQHRVNAFEYVTNVARFTDLQLICSVYFDLPIPYQAFLFATINSNQKKVDRSLALEQFGYNVNDEKPEAWTPEKFAVFLSRKLNIEKAISPFYQHIRVAPLNAQVLFEDGITAKWVVSTATIVDGISSLISSNPIRDRILMQQKKSFLTGRSRELIRNVKDLSPLRTFFVEGKDQAIYDTLINYFNFYNKLLWSNADSKSYIIKTVGIQASFDILKAILKKENSLTPQTIDFNKYLSKVVSIDFTDKFFQASGIGRSRIKNIIGIATRLIQKEKIKKNDLPFYENLLTGKSTSTDREKWIWDDEAENAVINALDKAVWDFGTNSVNLYLEDDYEEAAIFKSYESLFFKLVEIAEIAFVNNLPNDHEFAEEQQEKFDAEDLVRTNLEEYKDNLKQLGWL